MRTRYSEDQQAVAEAFAELFGRESTTEAVRAAEAGCGFDPALWDTLAAAGATGMALPEEFGGGGASLVDLGVVVYEWGRRIAPVPLVEHAVATRLLVAAAGNGARRDRGDAGTTRAGHPATSTDQDPSREHPATSTDQDPSRELAVAAAGGGLVATVALRPSQPDGMARLVPAGAAADLVMARQADALVVHRSDPPSVARPNTAGLPLADRDLADPLSVATGELARRGWERALAEWKALTAVAYAGLAAEVLDMGVAYVKQRHQFGVPVGSFQAVQHGLADAATRVEGARLLAFRAVCALDAADGADRADNTDDADDADNADEADGTHGRGNADRACSVRADDARRLAAMALLFAAESARFACDRVLQYHGGYGYSAEYDVQLYYRRAAAWALQLGEPGVEFARLAEAELGPKSEAA